MKFPVALQKGIFEKRYKRFFADIRLQGKIEVAHVANTGSMKSVNQPGVECLVQPSQNPERKLKFSLEALKDPKSGAWVGVNTANPNKLVKEAFENGVIPHWKKFTELQAEVKISKESRIDFVLSNGMKKHFVEVKNVTLAENSVAQFPDSVTERGQKHLRELITLLEESKDHSCEIFFLVQRNDCQKFSPADSIDPEYGRLLRLAHEKGVLVSAYVAEISEKEIVLTNQSLAIKLKQDKGNAK